MDEYKMFWGICWRPTDFALFEESALRLLVVPQAVLEFAMVYGAV